MDWVAGQQIVLTTTVWKDNLNNQNEVLTISSVSVDGKVLTLTSATQFYHYG